MEAWLLIIITLVPILLTNGILYYSINRLMKKQEVKEKEVEVIKKLDEEWQKLYKEEKSRREDVEKENKELRSKNESLVKQNGLLELKNQQLTWYRCTINNCPNRRPPHVFDIDGNELEACS